MGAATTGKGPTHILAELLADPSVLLPFILIGFAAQLVDGALGVEFRRDVGAADDMHVPPPIPPPNVA